jgi:GLPGLI family protein
MKFHKYILVLFAFAISTLGFGQKTLNEGTLVYNMSVETGSATPKMADMLDGATTTIYIKNKLSKVSLVSGLGSESTVYNASTGSAFILKDYSGQKLMFTLTPQDWNENNSKYKDITFENTGESANIAGYNCKKAIAKLKNGTSFTVYYTTEVTVTNKSYDPQFASLPGLPVQYEMQSGKMKFKFTLSRINFDAVSSSHFEQPQSGYRVLTYQESKAK